MVKAAPPPLQLVRETDGVYSVCEEGRKYLECLSPELPLAVVVVAGRYRTGKSFLLNRGLLETGTKGGFQVGSSINACTRGVWLHPMPLPAKGEKYFLVLDTEGTASLEARADQDARLIGIALSLASVFVFNATGSLDETSLSDLATLSSVAQGITADTDKWSPPELVWVLRDFALQLVGDEGEEISAEQYLERALSEERYGKGGVRSTLKHFFPRRTLLPMVRPCVDEAKLQKLSTLAASSLRPEFLQQLEGFRDLVKAAATRPKEIGGIALNGPAIARLALAAVASVNEGKAPSIQTTFDFLQEGRCREYEEEALSEMEGAAAEIRRNMPTHSVADLPALERPPFMAHLPELWAACEEKLLKRRRELEQALKKENAAAQAKIAAALLKEAERDEEEGEAAADAFSRKTAALEGALGAKEALALAPRLHEIYTRGADRRRQGAEERARCADERRALLEASLTSAEQESARLREEVDQALLAQTSSLPAASSAVTHEECSERIAETRREAQTELHALSETRDRLARELLERGNEVESARAAEAAHELRHAEEAARLRTLLLSAEASRDAALVEVAEKTAGAEARQRSDLDEIKADFEAIVRQCEARAHAAQDERSAAEARSLTAERALQEGAARVAEELSRLEELGVAARKEHEEARRKQTQDLLERRQIMTEAYSGIVQDSQRAREAAMSADRRLMMVEVEKDSLKRRVDTLEEDSRELAKTRRLYDDVRFRHAAAEAANEASAKLQEMQKSQLQRLEAELREVRVQAQQRDLEMTRRTATLELQLQARGIAT